MLSEGQLLVIPCPLRHLCSPLQGGFPCCVTTALAAFKVAFVGVGVQYVGASPCHLFRPRRGGLMGGDGGPVWFAGATVDNIVNPIGSMKMWCGNVVG